MTSLAVQKGPDSAVGGGKQPLAPPVSPSPRRLPHPRPSPHLPHPLNRPPWRGLAPSPGRRSGLGCPRAHAHLLSWPFGGLQRGQASLWVEWERPEDTSLPSDRVSVPALLLPAGSGGIPEISACSLRAPLSVRFWGAVPVNTARSPCAAVSALPPGSSDPWRWPRPGAAPHPRLPPPAGRQEAALSLCWPPPYSHAAPWWVSSRATGFPASSLS